MGIEWLLEKMKEVVDNVMTAFQTDFTEHDTDFILKTEGYVPFIWVVRESGTHIYSPTDEHALKRLKGFLEAHKYSGASFLIYVYTGEKLMPIFRDKLDEWAEKLLRKLLFV